MTRHVQQQRKPATNVPLGSYFRLLYALCRRKLWMPDTTDEIGGTRRRTQDGAIAKRASAPKRHLFRELRTRRSLRLLSSFVMAAASAAPARGRNGTGERGEDDQALTRILVVEDDEFMAAALVSMLQTIAETNTASGAELCLQVPSVAPLHAWLCAASIRNPRAYRSSTRAPVRVLGTCSVPAATT